MAFSFQVVLFPPDSLLEYTFASLDILSDLLVDSNVFSSLLVAFLRLFYLSLFLDLSDCKDALSEDLNY